MSCINRVYALGWNRMGGSAEWLREYYSLQPSNLITEYTDRRRSRDRLQDRDYLPTKETRARARVVRNMQIA